MGKWCLITLLTFHWAHSKTVPKESGCSTLPSSSMHPQSIYDSKNVCNIKDIVGKKRLIEITNRYCFVSLKPTFADDGILNSHVRLAVNSMSWKKHIEAINPEFNSQKKFLSPDLRSDESIKKSAERFANEALEFDRKNSKHCPNGYIVLTKSRGGNVLYLSQFLNFSKKSKKYGRWDHFLRKRIATSVNASPALGGSLSGQVTGNYLRGKDLPKEFSADRDKMDLLQLLRVVSPQYDVLQALKNLEPHRTKKTFSRYRKRGLRIAPKKFQVITLSNAKRKAMCKKSSYKKLCYSDDTLGLREQLPFELEKDTQHSAHICSMSHTGDIRKNGKTRNCDAGLTYLALLKADENIRSLNSPPLQVNEAQAIH